MNTHAALDSSTALALERTRLAHERTLMAWVRTATSLISFGFTIYKAFEYLRQRQPDVAHGVLGPHRLRMAHIEHRSRYTFCCVTRVQPERGRFIGPLDPPSVVRTY